MLLAVGLTLLDSHIISFQLLLVGLIIGTLLGAVLAMQIQMTAMPQLVALFNGLGGGASALVAGAALVEAILVTGRPPVQLTIATLASGSIGALTFWGSLVAFSKLQGLISSQALHFPGQRVLNSVLTLALLIPAVVLVIEPSEQEAYWLLVGVASLLGMLTVMPIGGADMPVVIAFLNSCSGLAAAATGFVLLNNILIIAGSLVGASGLILTRIMCRAMNRSLTDVLFGNMSTHEASTSPADSIYAGRVKSTSAEEVALLLDTAHRVVIVPGYGMAVAQAQHAVADLTQLLEQRGIEVEFGIHPVAGRMPGHMNVLLAEASIPYEQLKDLDEINASFDQTDVVLIIGANDVVNPLARTDPSSPIAGMPILDVDHARTVVVIKRSLSPGFAGIPNPLFAADTTLMLFGDGKQMVLELINAVEEI
jgi:NAD(P) transhydrogenase subunit beta